MNWKSWTVFVPDDRGGSPDTKSGDRSEGGNGRGAENESKESTERSHFKEVVEIYSIEITTTSTCW